MTSLLCVPDLHLSDKPPTNCSSDYLDQLFTMLDEVVEISARCDAVVFAGDIFHIKQANRTSHRTVQRMIDVVQAFPVPVYLVAGNHDLAQDRLESIYETQPFGTLLQAGARLLTGWSRDFPLYGAHWEQDWQNPGDFLTGWLVEGDARHGALSECLFVTHAPIFPPGKENPWECIPASTFAEWLQEGSCFYGHVHDYHGVFTVDDVTFCNFGAVSRGSLHEEDLTRHPSVAIWHSDRSGEEAFERVKLASAPPASEVFKLAEHAEKADYRERLDQFLSAVGQSTVSLTSVESVLDSLRSLDLSSADYELAEEVLEAAQAGSLK